MVPVPQGVGEMQECFSWCNENVNNGLIYNIPPVSLVVPSIYSPAGNDRNKHSTKISSDLSRHLSKSVTQHNKRIRQTYDE